MAAVPALEKSEEESKPEKVLVVHRIESAESDSGPYIIFSAVGYVFMRSCLRLPSNPTMHISVTAIFAFPYKMDGPPSDILSFDFGQPVLDFSVIDGSKVVVTLDGAWVAEGSPEDSDSYSMVRIVNVSGGQVIFSKSKRG